MAYPPVVPPATRTNATPQLDTHPADHNAISTALSNMPWGRVAYGTNNATGTVTAAADIVNVTFTAVAGRRYKVSASLSCQAIGGAVGLTLTLTDAANVAFWSGIWSISAAGFTATPTVFVEVAPGGAGSRTYKLRLAASAGGVTMAGSGVAAHQLLVEDIGQ